MFADLLTKDAIAYGIQPMPSVRDLARPLPYQDASPALVLDPSDPKTSRGEALGLAFEVSLENVEGKNDPQMILAIGNTTDAYLAYRVTTRPSRGVAPCRMKLDLAHNAIALAPRSVERRSECIWNRGWTLAIDRVETIQLSQLSYTYLSLLPAGRAVGLDPRTAAGHRPPVREGLCRVFLSADVETDIARGRIPWRDVMDFYARHRCKTYGFPSTYKAVEPGEDRPLPATDAAQ
jgi:hypothetical protein